LKRGRQVTHPEIKPKLFKIAKGPEGCLWSHTAGQHREAATYDRLMRDFISQEADGEGLPVYRD